jgi:hypothetical protein
MRRIAFICAAAALMVSCKKEEEVSYPPSPPQDYTRADAAAPARDAAAAPTAAPADAAPPAVDAITKQLLDESIKARAKKEAAGMKAQGELFSGVVATGGQIESPLMIESKKCYGVVAEGATSVQELDVQIMAKPGLQVQLPGPVIAVDSMQGNKASISPCWKNAFPVAFPATVIVKATKGAGAVAARVYVK